MIKIGSPLCNEQARVVELLRGWVVECSCGGTIGLTFPSPFDTEYEASEAARLHIQEHAKDAVREAALTTRLADLAGVTT